MPNPFIYLEKLVYFIRDTFWSYPDKLFGENSLSSKFGALYKLSIPYSHFVVAFFAFTVVFILFGNTRYKAIIDNSNKTLIEAVVMGVDNQGRLQRVNKVNPILPTNIQLEKNLINLIYEPLIKFEYVQQTDGTWQPQIINVLASEVVKIKEGSDYQFNLKRGIRWHDNREFNADDVIATLNLVSNLNRTDNAYIKAIKQMRWEKVTDYSLRLCTQGSNAQASCNESTDNPIFSNFLELVSISIVPAHKVSNLTENQINNSDADIFRSPIGTGKYRFFSADNLSVTVVRNEDYFYAKEQHLPQIQTIRFKYYATLDDAVKSIKNGETHSLASISVEYKNELEKTTNVKINLSPVLDNQYWGLYFNLKKDPDGKAKGPAFFQNQNVRTAISSAISRYEIIENALLGVGEEAFGPITQKSQFFNKNAGWATYNPDRAAKLLEQEGWTLKGTQKFRTNNSGEELSFSLYFVNSFDRLNVARVIQKNLESIGVKVIIDRRQMAGQDASESSPSGWTLDEVNREVLAPRSFDAILYGMNTFIDPDRFELFHSSQSVDPGLNISSYSGSAQTVRPRENRQEGESSLETLPKVDRLLEVTRTFDPSTALAERLNNYLEIQTLIAQDSPVAFLYHPQFIYYTNTNIIKTDLNDVSSVEDRFRNIQNWEIK
jgi:peptide/nickel transport system substrate-binding protein